MASALCQTDGSPARIGPYQEDLLSTPPPRLVRAPAAFLPRSLAGFHFEGIHPSAWMSRVRGRTRHQTAQSTNFESARKMRRHEFDVQDWNYS
eukprot:13299_4